MKIQEHKNINIEKCFRVFRVLTQSRVFSCFRERGFTLIEFLLYIGLVGIVLTVAGAIGLNVFFGKAKLGAIEEVSQNARFAMERVAQAVQDGQDASIFTLSGGALLQNGMAITTGEVVVTDFQISDISYPGAPGTKRIQMTIKFNNPENRQEYNFEKTFYTTANIRKK